MCIVQGRNEVRRRLEHETSLPPHVRTWGLSEANVLFWKKVLMAFLKLFGHRSDSEPKNRAPYPTRYVSGVMQWKSENIPKANRFSSSNVMNICNFRKQYGMDLAQTDNKGFLAAFQVSSCGFVSLPCLPHAFLRCGPVFVLLIIKHFGHWTSNFFKVR